MHFAQVLALSPALLHPIAYGDISAGRVLRHNLCVRSDGLVSGVSARYAVTYATCHPCASSSGKTHTMEGGAGEQRGVYARALADLFATIDARSEGVHVHR